MAGEEEKRDKAVRARNRALLVVLIALALLFYALTIVKMTGG